MPFADMIIRFVSIGTSEAKEGLGRGRDAETREGTAKHWKEGIGARMDRAKDAEIEGGVNQRAKERRVAIMQGMMEGNCRAGNLVSYSLAFAGMEMPCTVIQ
jgi:hypothetical protein